MRKTQFAEFFLVTSEQSKLIKPADTTIFSRIPDGDPYLTTYLHELIKTNQPEQQNNRFWIQTRKDPGKSDYQSPIQTPILVKLHERKEEEKLNSKDDAESRKKFLSNSIGCTHCSKKLRNRQWEIFEYHDIFTRQRMDFGMDTEFEVKLTLKVDKAVCNQSLLMPIHLKEDLNVKLDLMHRYGIITVLLISTYASFNFKQREPN